MTLASPHTTLMMLHRLVDRALAPLIDPMGLSHATEGYVTVSREDLLGLAAGAEDPQTVLIGFGATATTPGMLIAEPMLCSTVLSRIWRSDRNEGAPLTQVENEIVRQFLARVVGQWNSAWANEGVKTLPELTMASTLSMLKPQMVDGPWHIARTVVRDETEVVGVLLFCYPAALLPQLDRDRERMTWRSRIQHGLSDAEQTVLQRKLATTMHDVVVTAPVAVRQLMTLGSINSLERGDVLAFDTNEHGAIMMHTLDREITGRLARTGDNIAVMIDSASGEPMPTEEPQYDNAGYDGTVQPGEAVEMPLGNPMMDEIAQPDFQTH